MSAVRPAVAVAITLLLMAALVWSSTVPLTVARHGRSLVRLAWSARPERIEKCRPRTEAELAQLPQHMRQPLVCEGYTAEYDLRLRTNGRVVLERRVHGAGLRRDRRLYVLEEIEIEPGPSTVEVSFDRVGASDSTTPPTLQGSDNAPPHLTFAERFDIAAGEVVLITYSPAQGALIARRAEETR